MEKEKMRKEVKEVLEQVFGCDSESESESESEREWKWESIPEVNGLWVCPQFLSPGRQARIISAMESEKWFPEASINQAMRFGVEHLPWWASPLAQSIRRSVEAHEPAPLPLELAQREPLFDQMIANVYEGGEGICPHVDLLRFDDGIAILSFLSDCVMHFTHTHTHLSVPVLLTPGSLLLMSGEARYLWNHQINRSPLFQIWRGHHLSLSKRISITLRKLSSSSPPITLQPPSF